MRSTGAGPQTTPGTAIAPALRPNPNYAALLREAHGSTASHQASTCPALGLQGGGRFTEYPPHTQAATLSSQCRQGLEKAVTHPSCPVWSGMQLAHPRPMVPQTARPPSFRWDLREAQTSSCLWGEPRISLFIRESLVLILSRGRSCLTWQQQ